MYERAGNPRRPVTSSRKRSASTALRALASASGDSVRCVSETLRGGVDRRPQAVVVVVDVPVGGEVAGHLQQRVAEHPVAVVAQPHVLLHHLRLLQERLGPQFDVRHARARAHPDAALRVGDDPLDVVVWQVALSGEVLEAVARGRLLVHPRQTLGAAGPDSAVGRADVRRLLRRFAKGCGDRPVVGLIEGAESSGGRARASRAPPRARQWPGARRARRRCARTAGETDAWRPHIGRCGDYTRAPAVHSPSSR